MPRYVLKDCTSLFLGIIYLERYQPGLIFGVKTGLRRGDDQAGWALLHNRDAFVLAITLRDGVVDDPPFGQQRTSPDSIRCRPVWRSGAAGFSRRVCLAPLKTRNDRKVFLAKEAEEMTDIALGDLALSGLAY